MPNIFSEQHKKNIKRNFIEIRQDCFVSLVKQSWILFWVFLSEFEIFNDPIEIQNDPAWMNWNSQRILFILRVLDIVKSLYSTNPTQDSWKKIPGIFPLNPFWCSTGVFYAFGCISVIFVLEISRLILCFVGILYTTCQRFLKWVSYAQDCIYLIKKYS